MHSYRVVREALRDPVAFELILLQIENDNLIDNPDEGHDYASELVEVFRKIQPMIRPFRRKRFWRLWRIWKYF
jgi:hypothetical protein